ncbi:MAG: hypothetical protein JWO30_573 [Fibrobacteres bacterium]|nr:hypothetical protein [Fibrobacterota bacterium]
MRNRMRHFAFLSVIAACLAQPRAQNQTNVTVEGDQADKAKDTVKVVPEGYKVVPDGNGGTVAVPDQAYTPPDTASEVGAIPKDQTKVLQNRKEAKRFTGAGFGPAGFGNIDERMPAYDVYVGRFWEVNRFAAIKALGEVASDFNNATLSSLQLGANMYASPTAFSPYIGGDLGLGYGMVPGDRNFGFNVGASVGALLFRTSNAQMNLEGAAQMMLSQLDDKNTSLYTARLGVLF